MYYKFILSISILLCACAAMAADDDRTLGTGTVTDAVNAAITKSSALLSGNLDIEVGVQQESEKVRQEYAYNAIGQRVPKSTAVKAAGALHHEEELSD